MFARLHIICWSVASSSRSAKICARRIAFSCSNNAARKAIYEKGAIEIGNQIGFYGNILFSVKKIEKDQILQLNAGKNLWFTELETSFSFNLMINSPDLLGFSVHPWIS